MHQSDYIILQGVRTHNLKNIDVRIPKNQITTITGVSGSGKSSLAFETIYKEGQFRYIESLSSYLRNFFSLGTRPELDYSEGLSPAIAIEQNKRVANSRSSVGTITELDDYLRLLMTKCGNAYCYVCNAPMKAQTTDQIISQVQDTFLDQKVFLLQEMKWFSDQDELSKFLRKNRRETDAGEGITRLLIGTHWDKDARTYKELIEYFYLEDVKLPHDVFPVQVFGIFDRVVINGQSLDRLREDAIKMLSRADKFGILPMEGEHTIAWYTDKAYCPQDNISYPEFTTQHFSPNRPEGACPTCHGTGEQLQVDYDKVLDMHAPYLNAILPWRDSNLGQAILKKLAKAYDVEPNILRSQLEPAFQEVVLQGDGELYKINVGGEKFVSMYYRGLEDVLRGQYEKGVLTVDFQAMLDLRPCPTCAGAKLRQESLNVFLEINEQGGEEKIEKEKNNKNIIILHGYTGRPDKNRLPWIKIELEKLGHQVTLVDQPYWDDVKIEEKKQYILDTCEFDENTILIGHSLGSLVGLRVLESLSQPIHGFISIGGFIESIFGINKKVDEGEKYNNLRLYFHKNPKEQKLNWKLIKKNANNICLLGDINDETVLNHYTEKLAKKMGVPVLFFDAERSHVTGSQEPKLFNYIIEFLGHKKNVSIEKSANSQLRYNLHNLQSLSIDQLVTVITAWKKSSGHNQTLVDRICTPLLDRANTISSLGLGYLQTTRAVDTLSGGEIQRLRLAKQLGNKLGGIIYVLDEPTIGLDTKEIVNTIKAIKGLKEMGNTIIVVEHNEAFIKESDYIVEIGPGAGDFGGNLVFQGPIQEFMQQDTLTAQYITGKRQIEATFDHKPSTHAIKVRGARKYNLQNVTVDIPLGGFTVITGGSGAGKTTLLHHTLFAFLQDKQQFVQSFIRLRMLKQGMSRQEIIASPVMKRDLYQQMEQEAVIAFYEHLAVDDIKGFDKVDNVLYVDQASIGKTPRSCPATFVGVFDDIRTLYAGATDAKMLGFNSGHFSFNSKKGACPECNGYGYKRIELQFLPDTYVPCSLCKGARYKPEILSIKRHGKSISEVLDMYVFDAMDLFHDMSHIARPLQLMCDIGLGYLKMGQPAQMLSGGESQRIKLVKHLLKSYKGHTMYFLDEPTVGLHPHDIEKLLLVMKKFLDQGDTIVMIEHEKNLLRFADKVITLEEGRLV